MTSAFQFLETAFRGSVWAPVSAHGGAAIGQNILLRELYLKANLKAAGCSHPCSISLPDWLSRGFLCIKEGERVVSVNNSRSLDGFL